MDLLTLIKKEQASGCHDASVFGGFGMFVAGWGKENNEPALVKLGLLYKNSPSGEREALLAQMAELLAKSTADISIQQQSATLAETSSDKLLQTPLTALKNIGSKRAQQFAKLGVATIGELLELFPRDYRDRRKITPIAEVAIGESVTIRGSIISCELSRARSGMAILSCLIRDESGLIPAVWFNQPFLQKKLQKGRAVQVFGRLEKRFDSPALLVSEYHLDAEMDAAIGIIPVYPGTEGLSQKAIRAAMELAFKQASPHLEESLPEQIIRQRGLLTRRDALRAIHFPEDEQSLAAARERLAYEELLLIQLALAVNAPAACTVQRATTDDALLLQKLQTALPFPLTDAQQRVIGDIYADMSKPAVMARLVQGDVGSGKTMVAAAAILKCCAAGRQAALMAPTEILARQHFAVLSPLLQQLGISCSLITGRSKAAERAEMLVQLESGEIDCLIGTHALIQHDVVFCNLGLAITDEQHRFGVNQRARLRGSENTDLLVLTATPIPRTLAMTLYADLNISIIDQLPPGRQPVKTYAVPYSYEQRIYKFIDKQIAEGRQAFIVCPLIEDSEQADLVPATKLYETLRSKWFRQRRVSLLHGRMKPQEKDEVMSEFRAANSDILVSTTVVEVGVDVPNATVMLIHNAERFGLAQLHQLRGRIGRGSKQAFCILLHAAESEVAKERMEIICQTTDGLQLAEKDLQLRGAGEIFGQRQHGLPVLKIANLFRDAALLAPTREDAVAIAEGRVAQSEGLLSRSQKLLQLMA